MSELMLQHNSILDEMQHNITKQLGFLSLENISGEGRCEPQRVIGEGKRWALRPPRQLTGARRRPAERNKPL